MAVLKNSTRIESREIKRLKKYERENNTGGGRLK